MATRHVWYRYNVNKNALDGAGTSSAKAISTAYYKISAYRPSAEMAAGETNYTRAYYSGSGTSFTAGGTQQKHSVLTYGGYLYTSVAGNSILCVVPDDVTDFTGWSWVVGSHVWLTDANGSNRSFQTYYPTVARGDYVELVSTSSKSDLKDGYDGSYNWFVYQGSENVTITNVALQGWKIIPGQDAAVVITGSGGTYSGLSYEISYSSNGGNYTYWGQSEKKTFSIPIPTDSESFRLRVYARTHSAYIGSTSWTDFVYSTVYYANSAPNSPSSVTIPSTVDAEEDFTVSWSEATDPDGNLSGYEVQRSYDGSSGWTDVTTSATGTSLTDFVARGYTSIQYRVRAKDSKGLTSSWTYSNIATIRNMLAYAGIGDKARKIDKIYIGVNGKARQIVKGYIGVNGKARKFL